MVGDQKSLPIAKNHPKPSQEYSEQLGGLLFTKFWGFSKNLHEKVHANFAQSLGRQILGNILSALKWEAYGHSSRCFTHDVNR